MDDLRRIELWTVTNPFDFMFPYQWDNQWYYFEARGSMSFPKGVAEHCARVMAKKKIEVEKGFDKLLNKDMIEAEAKALLTIARPSISDDRTPQEVFRDNVLAMQNQVVSEEEAFAGVNNEQVADVEINEHDELMLKTKKELIEQYPESGMTDKNTKEEIVKAILG